MDWTAAVSGGAGLLGQLVGGLFGRANQKYQNEWNLEMWHRQNEYNSPIQQMARYQEAGLNPNLIYSQGSPGNSQSMPSSAENKYQPDFSFVGNSLMQGMQSEQMQHQNEVLKADQRLKIVQALKTSNEAYGIDLDNIRKLLENDALPEQLRLDLAQRAENLTNKMNENALQLQQINFNADTYDSRVGIVEQEWNNLKQEFNNLVASEKEILERIKWIGPEAQSRINSNNAMANLSNAEAKEIYALMDDKLLELKSKVRLTDAQKTEVQNRIKKIITENKVASIQLSMLELMDEVRREHPEWFKNAEMARVWVDCLGTIGGEVVDIVLNGKKPAGKTAKVGFVK